jgi:hypothetical protein
MYSSANKEQTETFAVRTAPSFPSILLVLVGTADLLTTIVGVAYFGAVEINPLMANLVSTNLPAFAALKLASTLVIAATFYQAKKMLPQTPNKTFGGTQALFKIAYAAALFFLIVIVANNIVSIAQAI